ncbi:MAG: hypothetical protein A2604_01520 [Candidatus Liptonbacteria bacterium RIFOXYD1_FULL_36_11]|uniref:Bacterial sugar transferase domain-containing protein n=1 Tax=Candidatus Liptonbacteria bacterium RIFOXYD1_FULL_36_11 TaxID=1798656 RepID=A0A1G2CT67_9BACT|nr:MAG: hypothetical protein A2604_01520 [Candidatus Liptonbacteria bacterium RIFOXYD1_FULL_36_11]
MKIKTIKNSSVENGGVFVYNRRKNMSWYKKRGKRLLDITVSLVALPVIFLFFPFIALAIKLDSKGQVFFKSRRVSKGRIVIIYKFRTMVVGAEKMKKSIKHLNERNDGPFFKIKNDPRVTKVGKILRKFWIDELLQFFNVLKGDISLVGPRPYPPEEVFKYPKEYAFLSRAKAGITGLSQINGSSSLPFLEVLKFDSYYVKNVSLRLDLKILWKTLLLIRKPSGV